MASEMIQYQTEDGVIAVRLQARDGNVWLSQADIAELFQGTPQAITQHIRAIYEDGELDQAATCNDYLQVRTEGKREVSRTIARFNGSNYWRQARRRSASRLRVRTRVAKEKRDD